MIHPGNQEFVPGDKVSRPKGGNGSGSGSGQAGNGGEGTDDFVFELSRAEFLELFFEDLELPNLVRTQLATLTEFKSVRAGFSSAGNPSNIDIVRSLRSAMARRIAFGSQHKRRIAEIEEVLECFRESGVSESPVVRALLEELSRERACLRSVPFIDTFDLNRSRIHIHDQQPALRQQRFPA